MIYKQTRYIKIYYDSQWFIKNLKILLIVLPPLPPFPPPDDDSAGETPDGPGSEKSFK